MGLESITRSMEEKAEECWWVESVGLRKPEPQQSIEKVWVNDATIIGFVANC